MGRLTLEAFIQRLSTETIEETYKWLAYDYALEVSGRDAAARSRFLALLAWKTEPTSELVRRFFNQINTYFAEHWALHNLEDPPDDMLLTVNRLCLYRQDKHIGLRIKNIAFGIQKHLEPRDPRRASNWLYGLAPRFVGQSILNWSEAVKNIKPSLDMALLLTMILIAIHPFTDANGRVARLAFTWLCNRWKLDSLWLSESSDGELLRTGHGIRSTEYLMAMLMFKLAGEHNVIDPGYRNWRNEESESAMFMALNGQLHDIQTSSPIIVQSNEFSELKEHLLSENHLCNKSPRFDCLRTVMS